VAIVGGIIGGLSFLAAIILVIFFAMRKNRNAEDTSREKFEFRIRSWPNNGSAAAGVESDRHPGDPFKNPTPRSGSPAGWSISGEVPVKVVYSDTSMPFRELPPLKVKV
jgi:hypothetical protein